MNSSLGRILVALFWWGVTLVAMIVLASIIINVVADDFEFAKPIGFMVWAILTAYTVKTLIVSVPEVTGLATINLLAGGWMRPYGPGLHFKYPWEQVKDGNYINFRLVKSPRSETYPAKDGPALDVKWFFQYRPRLELLGRYIAVGQDVIDTGLNDVGSSFLSRTIAGINAEDCKRGQHFVEGRLKECFDRTIEDLESDGANLGIPVPAEAKDSTLEYLYGIHIVEVGLNDVDYEKRYQDARATRAIAQTLSATAREIEQKNKMTGKDSYNAALIINGQVKKNVQEVEGQGGQALAALLMAMARGGSDEKGEKKGDKS